MTIKGHNKDNKNSFRVTFLLCCLQVQLVEQALLVKAANKKMTLLLYVKALLNYKSLNTDPFITIQFFP